MERALDGRGRFATPDGLDIRVTLAVVFGDGPPRVEIESLHNPGRAMPVQAVDRAAKVFLFEIVAELRRHAYRARPFTPDPKPKDRGELTRVRVVTE